MALLQSGQQVDGYRVQSLIKANVYTETYRVEDASHQPFFMKVYIMKLVPQKLINPTTGLILEIEYSQKIKSRNVVSFISNGTINTEQSQCQYYVTNYFSGELLAEKLTFNRALTVGFGSMLSFLVGTLFKLIAGGFMLYYIIKDIF